MTLWPQYSEEFPHELYEHFVLPVDEPLFKNVGIKELVFANFMHQGWSAVVSAQIIRRWSEVDRREKDLKGENECLRTSLQETREGLEREKNMHKYSSFYF